MTTPTMITAPETDPLQEKIRYHASRAADCVITAEHLDGATRARFLELANEHQELADLWAELREAVS